jgi:hypothetical protein
MYDPNIETSAVARKQAVLDTLNKLQTLAQSPGWKLLTQYLEQEIQVAMQDFNARPTAEVALRTLTGVDIMKRVSTWPTQQIVFFTRAIEMLDEEESQK